MKKALMQVLFVLILLAPLAAQKIVVQTPASVDMLTQGDDWCCISWHKKNAPGKVKLQLVKADGTPVGEIDSKTGPFISPYKWLNAGMTSSGMAEPGDYRVRVITLNGTVWGDSGVFILKAKSEPPPPSGVDNLHGFNKKLPRANIDPGFQPSFVPLKPDLIVCKILPEILDVHLGSHMLKYRVHNIGKGDAEACTVWIDLCGVKGFTPVKALKAGEYEEFSYETVLPAIKPESPYTFHVDKFNKIVESDENNNVLSGTLSIIASEPAKCSDGQRHSIFIIKKK